MLINFYILFIILQENKNTTTTKRVTLFIYFIHEKKRKNVLFPVTLYYLEDEEGNGSGLAEDRALRRAGGLEASQRIPCPARLQHLINEQGKSKYQEMPFN
jgi:hypothetical protein